MHKLFSVLIGAAFLLVSGCSDLTTSTNAPDRQPIEERAVSDDQVLVRRAPVTLVKLPAAAGPRMEKSVSRRVTPLLGGTIEVSHSYQKATGGVCTLNAKLVIPPLAVLHDELITVTLDTINAAVKFQPEGLTFLVPSLLDYSATGLDPQSLGLILGFYFIDDNGIPTKMPAGGISINISAGMLGLRLGVIPHFSRYAFGRITDR